MNFQEFWDSCAQNKTSEIYKMDVQEFWDSCEQNKTSEISKQCTFRNSWTPMQGKAQVYSLQGPFRRRVRGRDKGARLSRSRGWRRYVLAPFRFFWCLWGTFGSPLVSFGPSCVPLALFFPFFWCPWGTCGSPLVSLGPSCAPLLPFVASLGPSGVPLVSPQSPRSSTWPIGEPLLDIPKERQSRARTSFSENL